MARNLFESKTPVISPVEPRLQVPFFRPCLGDAEIDEVVACLRSGWLTTGPRVRLFEREFAAAVGAEHALAVNSCTAALHLAVAALGLHPGQAVLVPTLTFAATAEVVCYQGATPLLVDCDPDTLHLDLADAERKLELLRAGRLPLDPRTDVVGILPVHVGGQMVDLAAVHEFAHRHGLWVVEDAAHAFPAAYRENPAGPWRRCGENTALATCFSFYANKTITTGEGGMVVTANEDLAHRMRRLSLHGLSDHAWDRYAPNGHWDYGIVEAGYKYNLTDVAASLGIHQLRRAESLRREREQVARLYFEEFAETDELELPPELPDRLHAWHLFPVRLRLERLTVDRNGFMALLRERGIGVSVHWRPLHLHPLYARKWGWTPEHCPQASSVWPRLVSLPLFPGMTKDEQHYVADVVRDVCRATGISPQVATLSRSKPR